MAFVARCFVDDDITHVENRIDPIADLDIIETELMLADMESLERRRPQLEKRAKGGDKESALTLKLVDLALAQLNLAAASGAPALSSGDGRGAALLADAGQRSATFLASSRSGCEVSHHSRSAYLA